MKSIAIRLAKLFVTGSLIFSSLLGIAIAQDWDEVEITTKKIAPGIYMLTGRGGNMVASIGSDGTFLIDDQFAPLTEKIVAALIAIGGEVPKFLVNTHWHFDHAGGNENLGKAGAVIVAHDTVRERMSRDNFMEAINVQVPASPPEALPVITFSDNVTFHLNGDTLQVKHIPAAHTDGDSVIWFEKANVLHTGDIYLNGFYPFIDHGSGGSFKGIIEATSQLIEQSDDQTVIIPGHGPLSNRKEMIEYRDMLESVSAKIDQLKSEGKTVEEIVAAKPTAELDAKWGNGFMKPDVWVKIISQ